MLVFLENLRAEFMSDYHTKGGQARMQMLTKQEKSDLGKKAASEKNSPSFPKATHSGILKIGNKNIECAVLKMPNGEIKRVLSARSIMKIMGRTRPNSADIKKSSATGMPVFLVANNLKAFIPIGDSSATAPIIFKNKSGHRSVGYDYRILSIACEAYLQARQSKVLTREQENLAHSCEILMRSFAQIGLVSLIDEASGFQEVRDKQALQALLDKYLRAEFAEWAKRFPNEFYKQIFRLNNWKFQEIIQKKPTIVGKYTNDIVYSRLLPELVDELEMRNPKKDTGYRDSKHHQWLNDVGHTDLNAHIRGVIAIMKASDNWKDFKQLLDKIYPIKSAKDVLIIQ